MSAAAASRDITLVIIGTPFCHFDSLDSFVVLYTLFIYRSLKELRERGRLKKTWWDCVKNDMESLGLSQKYMQFSYKWRRRIKGTTQVHLEKWPLKQSICMCVCVVYL